MFWKSGNEDLREVFPIENLPLEVLGAGNRDALSLLYRNQDVAEKNAGVPRIPLKSAGKAPEKAVFLKKMLPILDGFDSVLRYAKIQPHDEDAHLQNWIQALEGMHRRFINILESEGLVIIDTVGKPLDLTIHEVVDTREVTGIRHNYVIEEIAKGYKCGNRVLRDAQVIVAKNPDNIGVGSAALDYQNESEFDSAGYDSDDVNDTHGSADERNQ